ncbi:MAG: lytic murein transglycosylase [Hyphomonadaceae bacterium]
MKRFAFRTFFLAFGFAALLLGGCGQTHAQVPPLAFTASGDAAFDQWRADYAARALAQGRRRDVVFRVLEGLTPNPSVIELDGRQPEFVAPVWDYVNTRLSPSRIGAGQAMKAQLGPLLAAISQRYGVDGDIILGIWGLESNFGQAALPHDAARALATLAFEGRRRTQFEGYLSALIEMIERGYAAPGELKSSWAGALGQPQFMPDAYLSTAVDWDGDGKRDIWTNQGDVAASIANYLHTRGWRPDEPVFDEVRLPAGFDYLLADTAARSVADWAARGVVRVDGTPWSVADRALNSQLFLPAGAQGPALLLHPNFAVIRRYNASDRYALTVALLARAFAGKPGLVTPWPVSLTPLQRDEMFTLQTLLNGLGYDAGAADGLFGSATRRAVAAFQAAERLTPDGFPTADLLRAVRLRAGVSAPDPQPAAAAPARPLDRDGVRDLQRRLTRLGYHTNGVDGVIGSRTRAAIRAFERDHDLPVTGRATTRVLAQAQRAR